MKKEYESPKAEKMAFEYSDVVVASNTQCKSETRLGDVGGNCRTREIEYKVFDVV